MSVKILQRRSKLSPSHGSVIMNLDPPVKYNPLPNIITRIDNAFPHRKSVDGAPLGFLDRIKEFIHFKKPNIDLSQIKDIAQKLKIPGLVILGVSFIAGLIYLAYKLYKHFTPEKVNETIDSIMADFMETAPQLMQIPGWAEKIREEVRLAVESGDQSKMVEEIARIKTSIIEKQESLGENVGKGIDLFRRRPLTYRNIARGRGAIMPL